MILSSFWYHSGILGFLHVKFIADFRTMVMACSGRQFGLCRQFTYRTIIPPTVVQCRQGETQSRAPNQPNQIHTTPNTELRRSRTKNPRQTSCIWFNRQPILLQSSPIKLSSQSLSPKPSEPNSIKKTLILLLLES